MNDLRFAVRQLRKHPGFAASAVLTLGLGIGANTAIFSVVDAALLRPLSYRHQDRIVDVSNAWKGTARAAISPAEYFDYRAAVGRQFSAFGVYGMGDANLTGAGEPVRLRAGYVSAGVLEVLSVGPELGRLFTAGEEREHRSVTLISHGLWVRQFGADRSIIGQKLTLDGAETQVLGVLPPAFRLPDDYAAQETTDVVLPLGLDAATVSARGSHFLHGVGLLAPHVSRQEAQAALSAIAARFVAEFPDDYPHDMQFSVSAVPLRERVIGNARRPLLLLLGAAGFVLLIACANVANLMLVRLDARRTELAIREAIGAGRRRVVRQLLAESLTIGALGGVAGVALAAFGVRILLALQPPDLPRIGDASIDVTVLAFAAAIAIGTGILFGLFPALQSSFMQLAPTLRRGGGGDAPGASRIRRTLVAGQVGIALTLLVGAGLLARTLEALRSVDPGFRQDHVWTGRVSLTEADYPSEAQVIDGFRSIRDRVASIPGVRVVGGVSNLPLASPLGDLNFRIRGRDVREGEVSPKADWQVVTPGYFDAMGMRLIRGRTLNEEDRVGAPGAVVINQTMARRYWPGEDPLGERFVLGGHAGPGEVTVVGIVRDVRHGSLSESHVSQMYLPQAQFRYWNGGGVVRSMTLVVRAHGDPASITTAIVGAVHGIDAQLPVADIRTMDQVVTASLSRQRFLFALATAFALVALALGAFGIFGVVAFGVSRRTKEIGLRLALGARRGQVVASVLLDGGRMVAWGVAVGLLGALVLARLLRNLLFGVAPLDPFTLIAAPLCLIAVALAAMWLPAQRASRVDPMEALRHE